jgi:hypothetical protein
MRLTSWNEESWEKSFDLYPVFLDGRFSPEEAKKGTDPPDAEPEHLTVCNVPVPYTKAKCVSFFVR